MDVYCLAWFLLLVAQGAACKILIRLQAGVQVLVKNTVKYCKIL